MADVYYPVNIVNSEGETQTALFTRGQIAVAIDRAKQNLAEMPVDWEVSWHEWLHMDL